MRGFNLASTLRLPLAVLRPSPVPPPLTHRERQGVPQHRVELVQLAGLVVEYALSHPQQLQAKQVVVKLQEASGDTPQVMR